MLNEDSYFWLKELAIDPNFVETTPLSEKQTDECYNQELVLRFIVQRFFDEELKKEHSDVAPYLNAEMTRLLQVDSGFDYLTERQLFTRTFELLNSSLHDSAFKKYNHEKGRYEGAISLPVFEALTVGVSSLIEQGERTDEEMIKIITEKSKELTNHHLFTATQDKRSRPIERMTIMANLGKELFA